MVATPKDEDSGFSVARLYQNTRRQMPEDHVLFIQKNKLLSQ
jgi:hypothetical protein